MDEHADTRTRTDADRPTRQRWMLPGAILTREPGRAGRLVWKAERTRGRLIGYTDWPIYVGRLGNPHLAPVLWDHPEWWPTSTRQRAAAIIVRESTRQQAPTGANANEGTN